MVSADLSSTIALIAGSEADVLATVILTAAPDWTNSLEFADLTSTVATVTGFGVSVVVTVIPSATNSLEFADLMSTVAAVTGFGVCVVGTVITPATDWTDSVAFLVSDTSKKRKQEYHAINL